MDLNVLGQGLSITQLKTIEVKKRHYSKESLESLRHPYLETLPLFQDLLFHLTVFYEGKSRNSAKMTRWKDVLHNSLHSLLNELIYTDERNMQNKLLQQVSEWYYSKINPNKAQIGHTNRTSTAMDTPALSTMESTMRSTLKTPSLVRKLSTPQPKATNLLRTTYQAFVNQKPPDENLDKKLEKIFEAMQLRQKKKITVGRYKESTK